MTNADAFTLHEVVPRADLAYRPFLIASLLLGVFLGFALGLHVATVRVMESGRPERTADLIQAHGQAQLLGFAGLYVMGMSLRLLPRFTGGSLQQGGLLPLVLWPMVSSLLLRGAVLPWLSGDTHHAVLVVTTFGVMIASGAYLLIVAATLSFGARRADPSGTAFLLGAFMLFGASATATFAAIHDGRGGAQTIPYLADTAVNQLLLYGFLFVTIVGVALRSLPVMVGRDRPERGSSVLPRLVCAAAGVHALSLLALAYWTYSDALVVVADAGLVALGACILAFVWQAGVLRPRADRLRPASQAPMWLVRGAFFWLVVAALVDVYFGLKAAVYVELVTQPELDAARHALGLGLITNLILGMSMLILPEFAGERQGANAQKRLAVALAAVINVAVLLRVTPSLLTDVLTYDTRNLSVAVAGTLAELAVLTFAFYLLRLMWHQRHQHVR